MKIHRNVKFLRLCAWAAVVPLLISCVVLVMSGGCAKAPGGYTTNLPSHGYSVACGSACVSPAGVGDSISRPAIPGSRPSLDEEIWVITRDTNAVATRDAETPGSGMMVTTLEDRLVPMPLKHTDVQASVLGIISTVHVTQKFHNPYDGKIEASYVFPLSQNAAVSEFLMVIGERRIRGIIRDRKEAEQIYAEAKSQGFVASLLTRERPNVFTQKIANIEPGRAIDVEITYFNTLSCVDGWYEFVFPMVVGPHYNPAGSTNGIGAVAHGLHGVSGQATEVEYLKPGERSGHDIALQLDLNAGVAIEETLSRTHVVTATNLSPGRMVVTLAPTDRIPNKDFVFRYRLAGREVKSHVLTTESGRGRFFTMLLQPPESLAKLKRQPLEMVFVLDCSGSMSGRPIEQSKAAVDRALRQLQPEDTFQLINFSMDARRLGPVPVPATPENIRKGLRYLASLQGEGGTEMITGIKAALDFSHDPRRLRFVCFLTDGFIGNEPDILREIKQRIGDSRIFSFGIGSSVNRFLMEQMAREGLGVVAYLGLNDSAADIMDLFLQRISHPALVNVKVDWNGMEVSDVFPARTPDLFVGRPLELTGRFKGTLPGSIRVSGMAGGEKVEWTVPVGGGDKVEHGLPEVWARMKIADLASASLTDSRGEYAGLIKQVALEYGLMSDYTAFVAVDTSRRTEGAEGTTVPVAVPVPEGVKYKTTVRE